MKPTRKSKALLALGLLAASFGSAAAPATAAPAPPTSPPSVTFTLLSPLPTALAVGETAVIGVRVQSSEPFAMAIALSDAYYPGRGVHFDGSAAQAGATSGDLFLTITGRESTTDLPAVQDWPADEDWPSGVAPLAVRVGARFPGGAVIAESFLFSVAVR
ncbi:MAG: hypothetical protein ACR2KK_14375 [Acidimicrobiales bacterium]